MAGAAALQCNATIQPAPNHCKATIGQGLRGALGTLAPVGMIDGSGGGLPL